MPTNTNDSQKKGVSNTGTETQILSRNHRLLKPDGTFNVDTRGLPLFRASDAFQSLIRMSWIKFTLLVFTGYIAVNTFFAFIYYLIGTDELTNTISRNEWQKFLYAFFFSSQSLTTVGYGRVAPIGVAASSVAALESMIGLLGFALATGLLYGRFSRPNAKLLQSKNILMAPYRKGTALMFRIANLRRSQLVDVDVQVTYKRVAIENGKEVRQFSPLHLESHRMNMFPLSWTVIHAVTPESPLWGKSYDEILNEDLELLIYFKGYDETFSNNVHYRISYKASELVWGAKFAPNFDEIAGAPTIHYLNKISDYEAAPLPDLSRAESA